MEVVLAHPEGYEVMPEVEEIAKKQAEESGGSFRRTNDMKDAFKDADIVYPRAGLHLVRWKNVRNCMAKTTMKALKH